MYYPGDWVDVGKQYALQLINRGIACQAELHTWASIQPSQCGIVTPADNVDYIKSRLSAIHVEIPVLSSDKIEQNTIPFERAAFIKPGILIDMHIIAGLGLLERWDVVIPLWDYAVLAGNVCEERGRDFVKRIIRDLRVPLYDVRMMFIKFSPTTAKLMMRWKEYNELISDERLSFLCALYEIKPFVLALPCTWSGHAPKY